jgi:hypothetical protein
MSRYVIETPNGKEMPVEDFMITDMGLEAVQVVDDKVIMVLFLGDGTIIYDHESGKTKEDIQKAKEEYKKMAEHQQETFRERANQIIREAVEQGKGPHMIDPDDDEPEVAYQAPPGPEPDGYA